ncbi:unnamed protein product, partial [Meganyctiphanes norvegica]
ETEEISNSDNITQPNNVKMQQPQLHHSVPKIPQNSDSDYSQYTINSSGFIQEVINSRSNGDYGFDVAKLYQKFLSGKDARTEIHISVSKKEALIHLLTYHTDNEAEISSFTDFELKTLKNIIFNQEDNSMTMKW